MSSYTEQAIKKAIEGGWRSDLKQEYEDLSCEHTKPLEEIITIPHEKMFLDFRFWQALGKALGWTMFWGQRDRWKREWHKFIDHLIEGKSAEEFFEQCLKQ